MKRWTLRDAADWAQAQRRNEMAMPWSDAEHLAREAERRYRAMGGRPRGWSTDRAWLKAFRDVITRCQAIDRDPWQYVRAQLASQGSLCIEKGWKLSPGMLLSEKAERRYRDRGGADACDPDDVLVAIEQVFAKLYLENRDLKVRDAEKMVRKEFPEWSLRKTRQLAHVRFPALWAALYDIHPRLADSVRPPPPGWAWPMAKKLVYREAKNLLNRSKAAGATADSMPSLRIMLGAKPACDKVYWKDLDGELF